MTPRVAAAVALLTGLVVGGAAGAVRRPVIDDKRTLCASCHHSVVELEEMAVTPPHSTDFDASCHGCHVLPVRQYAQWSFTSVGMTPPAWVDDLQNPILGGQTCLECHLARGRGVVACEQCHADGSLDVKFEQRCEACHADRVPIAPHDRPSCRDCHPEVYMDPHGRAATLMRQKLEGAHDHHP